MVIKFGAIAKRSAPEDMKFYTSTGTVNCEGHDHLFNIKASRNFNHIEIIAKFMDENEDTNRLACAQTAKDNIKSAFKGEIINMVNAKKK
ncbi:MAG TPA: hypothetical protein DHW71_13565 [Gammaproteobacteria bacterium]|nr:hypothetical protein [Gammaproteobacteria bacterium]MEC8011185.1 hypothetical protein [Pseudomonadota bacterium]HBF08545.1 hypothetical protein [Gammaproteobacteria bacterium]HCK94017.1 hypothetical protein [Gammaproteobacteria bacterium]|tara:strand:- start:95 stop:364 length:270 start_codon:yes stop_codon:yes gene_type:complete